MRRFPSRSGSAYLVVIAFSTILFILMTIMMRVKSGHAVLQSKSAREFIATTVAEAGLNCIIGELTYDRAFRTHWHYRKGSDPEWKSPVKSRDTAIGSIGDLVVYGVSNGIYSGRVPMGTFKAKCAPDFGSKENTNVETLVEKNMFTRVEVVAHVGQGGDEQGNSYRKITALLETSSPVHEHLLFDGELLDLGFGPYQPNPNIFRRGRLYGHYWLTLNSVGGADQGSELLDMEKIQTPGMIRGLKDTRITFSNGSSFQLNHTNDSTNPLGFQTHNGYILDGASGGRPIKLTHLPKERIYRRAYRYRNTYGVIIEEGTLPYGSYRNPYDPARKYVDLDFGGFNVGGTSDDPEPIKSKTHDPILVYSRVPLRIWGCPDHSITIFSEQDIVIGGDFNQCPETPQDYIDENYQDYQVELRNGINGHKVGALLMSMGRIIIDISRPNLFAKNEMKPYFIYKLAKSLHPASPEIEMELKEDVCPIDPKQRRGIVGLGPAGPDGIAVARYGTIAWLFNNGNTSSGPAFDANVGSLKDFFTPGTGRPRFGIRDPVEREKIINEVIRSCRQGGDLTRDELDRIFEMAWDVAKAEEADQPDSTAGAIGMMPWLFDEAKKTVRDGIFLPEITVNANLVSSTRRASRWNIGNSEPKVRDEIGNVDAASAGLLEYLQSPRFVIQRVYGSEIRLGSSEPDYFIDGKYTAKNVLRRRIWDPRIFKSADYKPIEYPVSNTILSFSERSITKAEYDNFQ